RKEPIGAPIQGDRSAWSRKGDEVRIAAGIRIESHGRATSAEVLVWDQPKAAPDCIAEGRVALEHEVVEERLRIGRRSAAADGDRAEGEAPHGIDLEPVEIR